MTNPHPGASRHRAQRNGPPQVPILAALTWLALVLTPGTPPAADPLALQDCQLSDTMGLRSLPARCGELLRPEDPAHPDGRQVTLKVAVVPALTPTPADDALTVIAGGPGAASTEFYAAFSTAFERIRRRRDILLVDQRGTGESNALDCPFEEVDGGDYDEEQVRRLTQACLDALPGDPRFYTTSIAVQDLDAVREALGYEQLDVYGASYGTRVALHYLRRFPDSTRTVILDGVVPAQVPLLPEIATDAQQALEDVFARCEASAPCTERFPELRAQFAALKDMLSETPRRVMLPDPLTGALAPMEVTVEHLRAAIRLLSYSPYSISVMPLMIEQAATGNLVPLAAQARMTLGALAEQLSYGMHNAVVCTEDAPFFDEFLAREFDVNALEDTYLGPEQLSIMRAVCDQWPAGVIDDDFKRPVRSDVPVMVLSGEADPVTPPRNGERTIGPEGEYLTKALHLVVPGQGHGVADKGCIPRLLGEFVVAASHEALDTQCVERLGPAAFFLDFSATAP